MARWRNPKYPWAEYQRRWRAGKGASHNRNYAAGLREAVNAEKLRRGSCVDCGLVATPENVFIFDFDHRDPAEKSFNLSRARHRERGPGEIAAEMAKCDLRCSNCHRVRTQDEKHWSGHVRRVGPDSDPEGVLF